MKLYFSPGACSLAPHIALLEIERAFDLESVDLKQHRTASGGNYYAINPKGYVPALELGGAGSELLTEAAVVLQYIADLAPDRRLAPPAGTFARYHLEEWLSFIATEVHKQYGPLFYLDTPELTQARARAKLAERYVYIDSVLVDRGYLMGETFTVADCYLFAMVRWCDRFDIDRQLWPNLDYYYLSIFDRPSVQAALEAEGLLETHHHVRAG
jgi:glutathione S-transferase